MKEFTTYINGLPWSRDFQANSTLKAFNLAFDLNIWRRTAIFEVFERVQRAGGGLTWRQVKDLWNDVRDEVDGYPPPSGPVAPKPLPTGPKLIAPVVKQGQNGNGHRPNGNGQHQHTNSKPQDRRAG